MDKYRTMSGVRQGAGLLSGYKSPQGMLHGSWILRVFFMSDKGNSFIQYKKRILPDRACRLFSSAVL